MYSSHTARDTIAETIRMIKVVSSKLSMNSWIHVLGSGTGIQLRPNSFALSSRSSSRAKPDEISLSSSSASAGGPPIALSALCVIQEVENVKSCQTWNYSS